jgi:ParB family chromosome partitioning protein
MKSGKELFAKALKAGAGLHTGEVAVAAILAEVQESQLSVMDILPRLRTTRATDPKHVVELAESIAVLGLIEPIAVDRNHRILAGGHRWTTLRLLSEAPEERATLWAEIFSEPHSQDFVDRLAALPILADPVPVHIMPLNAEVEPALALAIDIGSNERRKSYTATEVRGLAATLKAVGYRGDSGKPKAGERTIIPALSAVIGKSRRTVYRMLAEEGSGDIVPNGTVSTSHVSDDGRLLAALRRWLKRRKPTSDGDRVVAAAEKLLQLLDVPSV